MHTSYDTWRAQARTPNAIKQSSHKVGQKYVQVFSVEGEQEGSGEPLVVRSKSPSLPEVACLFRQVEEEEEGGVREQETSGAAESSSVFITTLTPSSSALRCCLMLGEKWLKHKQLFRLLLPALVVGVVYSLL